MATKWSQSKDRLLLLEILRLLKEFIFPKYCRHLSEGTPQVHSKRFQTFSFSYNLCKFNFQFPSRKTKRENCSKNNNQWVPRNVPQKHCQKHIIQLGSKMYQKGLKMVFNSKNTLFAEHYAKVNGNSIKDSWTSMNEGRTRKSNDRSCENQSPILASKPFFFSLIIALIWIQDLFVLLGGRWHFQRFKRWRRT